MVYIDGLLEEVGVVRCLQLVFLLDDRTGQFVELAQQLGLVLFVHRVKDAFSSKHVLSLDALTLDFLVV